MQCVVEVDQFGGADRLRFGVDDVAAKKRDATPTAQREARQLDRWEAMCPRSQPTKAARARGETSLVPTSATSYLVLAGQPLNRPQKANRRNVADRHGNGIVGAILDIVDVDNETEMLEFTSRRYVPREQQLEARRLALCAWLEPQSAPPALRLNLPVEFRHHEWLQARIKNIQRAVRLSAAGENLECEWAGDALVARNGQCAVDRREVHRRENLVGAIGDGIARAGRNASVIGVGRIWEEGRRGARLATRNWWR